MNTSVFFKKYGTIVALGAVFAIFSVLSPTFGTPKNIIDLLRVVSILSIVALGATFPMVTGNFDLSVGAIVGLTALLAAGALKAGYPMAVVILVGGGVGLCIGVLNGVIVLTGVQSVIGTLSLMLILDYLGYAYTGGSPITIHMSESFRFLGQGYVSLIPFPVIIMIIAFTLAYVFLGKTRTGRDMYASGGNMETARLAGINVRFSTVLSFMLSGLLCGIAGVIYVSRLGTIYTKTGSGYLLDALPAVFIGMTVLGEGEPNVVGTLIGVLLICIMTNGFYMVGTPVIHIALYKGVILIGAVSVAAILRLKQD